MNLINIVEEEEELCESMNHAELKPNLKKITKMIN